MQNLMTHSFLVSDKVDSFPIPSEVKEITGNVIWGAYDWDVSGLPLEGAKYSLLNGKQLYLDTDSEGNSHVTKQDEFTGDVFIGSYFINSDLEGSNYMFVFIATFLKGELIETKLHTLKPFSAKEFSVTATAMVNKVSKAIRRNHSWWYRYLYAPYRFVVRGVALVLVCILNIFIRILTYLALLVTPI